MVDLALSPRYRIFLGRGFQKFMFLDAHYRPSNFLRPVIDGVPADHIIHNTHWVEELERPQRLGAANVWVDLISKC